MSSTVQASAGAQTVAACLIVRDEEERLPQALASLGFCTEIVVVDSGSRDHTVELASAAGARVVHNAWPGFAAQRNVALDLATTDWVLEIDADERVSEPLRRSLERFLADPPADVDAVAMARTDRFLGRRLTAAVHYPNYRFRLLRRGSHRHDESRTVHEGILPRGRVWALEGDIEHQLAATVGEAASDLLAYARLAARQMPQPVSVRAAIVGITVRPLLKFWYRLLIIGGWRDGWAGILWIARECLSDILVWLWALRLGGRSLLTSAPAGVRWHFEGESPPPGPARLVAVAHGPRAATRARRWLSVARRAGADVALITDVPQTPDGQIWTRVLPRLGLLGLIRALEAERQLHRVGAVAAAGWREHLLLALTPARLRGHRAVVTLSASPLPLATAPARRTRGQRGEGPRR